MGASGAGQRALSRCRQCLGHCGGAGVGDGFGHTQAGLAWVTTAGLPMGLGVGGDGRCGHRQGGLQCATQAPGLGVAGFGMASAAACIAFAGQQHFLKAFGPAQGIAPFQQAQRGGCPASVR